MTEGGSRAEVVVRGLGSDRPSRFVRLGPGVRIWSEDLRCNQSHNGIFLRVSSDVGSCLCFLLFSLRGERGAVMRCNPSFRG